MSLIYRHHLILPRFKLSETITSKNTESTKLSDMRKYRSPRLRLKTEKKMPELIQDEELPQNTNQSTIEEKQDKSRQLPYISPRSPKSEQENLNDYLEHLKQLKSQRQPQKQIIKRLRSEHEILQQESTQYIQKFKKVEGSQKRISLLDTVKNPHSQQYIRFSQQVYSLTHNLHCLKEYVNNSRKLFQVVKNLIGMKKNLKKILIKQQVDELIEFQDISKQCCIKETVYINGEQRILTKFDLSLYDDLVYMTEAIENLLLSAQLTAIKQMSVNIKKEEVEINKLKHNLKLGQCESKLSLQSQTMQRYNPHLQLESLEQRLGPMNYITKQQKQTSQALGEIVNKLSNDLKF